MCVCDAGGGGGVCGVRVWCVVLTVVVVVVVEMVVCGRVRAMCMCGGGRGVW